jgi:hypothetical protein
VVASFADAHLLFDARARTVSPTIGTIVAGCLWLPISPVISNGPPHDRVRECDMGEAMVTSVDPGRPPRDREVADGQGACRIAPAAADSHMADTLARTILVAVLLAVAGLYFSG